MSILSSMYIANSGMRANEAAIGVIGDNLAHLNTIGFKGSRAVFSDVLYRTVFGSGPPSQAGLGTQIQAIQRMVTQGGLVGTGLVTDVAIAGDGFLIVDGEGPRGDGRYFTRNGQLEIDQEGFLINPTGMRVQGFMANSDGSLQATLKDLEIAGQVHQPRATQLVNIEVNLDATTPQNPVAFDPANPDTTSQFSTTVTVFDSLGVAHQVDVYFERGAGNTWTYHVMVDGTEVGQAPGPIEIGNGTLTFDGNGNLQNETVTTPATVTFSGASPQTITFDFGDETVPNGSRQQTGPNSIEFLDQDGFAAGLLEFFTINTDGTVVGTFSNGQQRNLAQLALAHFGAPQELRAEGENLFQESQLSGEPVIGEPLTDGRGAIVSGTLEQSNVDLSTEFTQMIISQRAFQASSRTITTADQMLVELVNLKR